MKKYSEDMIKEAFSALMMDGLDKTGSLNTPCYRRNEVPYDVISDEVIEILKDLTKEK